jgi:hypothetical protein
MTDPEPSCSLSRIICGAGVTTFCETITFKFPEKSDKNRNILIASINEIKVSKQVFDPAEVLERMDGDIIF